MTRGGGGGVTSVTCLRITPVTGASERSAPQPEQHTGSQRMISSGSSTSGIVEPGCPGCLPGLRPEAFRDERRGGLRYGPSEDGGLLEVDESAPSCRSNSAIRTACPSTTRRSSAFAARSSAFADCRSLTSACRSSAEADGDADGLAGTNP